MSSGEPSSNEPKSLHTLSSISSEILSFSDLKNHGIFGLVQHVFSSPLQFYPSHNGSLAYKTD